MSLSVEKRDGTVVPFDAARIVQAVRKAVAATTSEHGVYDGAELGQEVATHVEHYLFDSNGHHPVAVETIQNAVERALMNIGAHDVAKAYILYRQKRTDARGGVTPADIEAFRENTAYFGTDLELFQFLNKYSRFDESKGRRETWPETVQRAVDFMRWHIAKIGASLEENEWHMLEQAILMREAMPSMRLLQMAGPSAMREPLAVYNCAYVALNSLRSFAELLYVLMQGTGISFTVESDFVEDLPKIRKQRRDKPIEHQIGDSTEGWCDALYLGLEAWFDGRDVVFDYSAIRPAGAKLKTKGGRASGPEPLRELLDFARELILSRQGKRLRTIDAHDLACKIGMIVVVGGVRRAAELSLSDLGDTEMRDAKTGEFWNKHSHRTMANNSAVYEEKPSALTFMEEWLALAKTGTGERGIFNRQNAIGRMPRRRLARIKESFTNWRKELNGIGCNPCGETSLLVNELCNLTLAVVRPTDGLEQVAEKVRLATIIGTLQASMTNFGYISEEWRRKCEAERLLGVDMPGIADHPQLGPGNPNRGELLEVLRYIAIETNQAWANRLGIKSATAITLAKPGGNSGVFLGVSHTVTGWNARHIIRHVRVNAIDPMSRFLIDAGVPHWPEVGSPDPANPAVWVFAFPLQAPETAYVNKDVGAIEMLENWLTIKKHWCEHNASVTIYIGADEWLEVGNWILKNWDDIGGLAFLPRNDHVYRLAPITAVGEEEFLEFERSFPKIPWHKFAAYEKGSGYVTESQREFACTGDACLLG